MTARDDTGLNRPILKPPPEDNPRREPVLDFKDRDLHRMTAADYDRIGFMSGLEVHQQILTPRKLFCRCPAGTFVDHHDAELLRQMRPTLSELGEYDGTALMEFKTRKEIHYLLERGTVCTYEIDDTPPFPIDEQAVGIAVEVALLFNLNLVSELHVMRKQYLDGSIPTGFQRTAMIGVGGSIPFRVPHLGVDKELRIRQLSLEEDSCREVSDAGHHITYRTDRLGMPLTEVVTEPDCLTPLELEAAARLIARNTRATGKVRRGSGAARQDVNVSVAGGRRVEIKGVDNHRGLPRLVHIEGFRQLNHLRIRAELVRRGVTAEMLEIPEEGRTWDASELVTQATKSLRHADFVPIRDMVDRDGIVCAVRLPGFGKLFSREIQPGVSFGREFEDRLRVIACLTGRPFMIHSDLRDFGLRNADWRQLATTLKADDGDQIVVLWGGERDVDTGVREIFLRAREALAGVPAETRQAFRDGTTGFERVLPGADRMYPDTDTPPFAISDAWVEEIRSGLPERSWAAEHRYRDLGLAEDTIRSLEGSPWRSLFEELKPEAGAIARTVAIALEKRVPHHWRQRTLGALPAAADLAPAVRALEAGTIRPDGFEVVLDRMLADDARSPQALIEAMKPIASDAPEINRRIREVVTDARRLTGKPADVVMRWATGEVLRPFRGRVEAAAIIDILGQVLVSDTDTPGHTGVES